MNEWYLEPFNVVAAIMAVLVVVLMIRMAVIGSRLKKLRKQYVAVMGDTGVTNIEEVVIELKNNLESQRQKTEQLQQQLATMQATLPKLKSKIGIHRYNAFSDGGSELSFSIAIVNDEKDGAVFSGLHSRESTYVYAKPVEKGESPYPLTPEEKKSIQEAK
ncbi:DUF4446 family protein [Paenibacillus sp. GSMTC-2017]|uniref:DUF4446 family protein n=1 Tax=Paenibacillus sp. GSMTC-2017 TaxID=2794350 RepID=UPI0018D9AE47|nr:DUF4446 family protein [Paenibacillus sp. GSMTC-2017]MBH5319310.1 DUF4446 family protein [Paenibacillus sp. GSMTC-2017]